MLKIMPALKNYFATEANARTPVRMEKLWQPFKNNSNTEFTLFIRTTGKRVFQLVEHLIAAIIAYISTH